MTSDLRLKVYEKSLLLDDDDEDEDDDDDDDEEEDAGDRGTAASGASLYVKFN
jgi:hypothetical protein